MNIPFVRGIFFCFLRRGNAQFCGMFRGKLLTSVRKYSQNEKAHLRHAFVFDFPEATQEQEAEASAQKLVVETARQYNKSVTKKIESRS